MRQNAVQKDASGRQAAGKLGLAQALWGMHKLLALQGGFPPSLAEGRLFRGRLPALPPLVYLAYRSGTGQDKGAGSAAHGGSGAGKRERPGGG